MAWNRIDTVGNFWRIIVTNITVYFMLQWMDHNFWMLVNSLLLLSLLLLFSVLSTHRMPTKDLMLTTWITIQKGLHTLSNLLFAEAKVKIGELISHSLQNTGTSWSRSLICHPLQVIGCLRFLTVSHLYKAQTFKNWTPFSILKHCFCFAALHGLFLS